MVSGNAFQTEPQSFSVKFTGDNIYVPVTAMAIRLSDSIPWPILAAYVAAVYLTYSVCLVVYRLYLSPLSKFPGPKLAAATQWYETHYELFYDGGGMFTKKIKKLHEQYGKSYTDKHWIFLLFIASILFRP